MSSIFVPFFELLFKIFNPSLRSLNWELKKKLRKKKQANYKKKLTMRNKSWNSDEKRNYYKLKKKNEKNKQNTHITHIYEEQEENYT